MAVLHIMKTDRQLIDGLRDRNPSAVEELIARYSGRVSALLHRCRVAESDMGTLMGDIVATIVDRVGNHALRDPEALPAYLWAVARRRVVLYRSQVIERPDAGTVRIAEAVLTSMGERDREALIRYYLGEQNPDQICRTFHLTAEQWQRMKSQAKTLFSVGGRKLASGTRRMPLADSERCVA